MVGGARVALRNVRPSAERDTCPALPRVVRSCPCMPPGHVLIVCVEVARRPPPNAICKCAFRGCSFCPLLATSFSKWPHGLESVRLPDPINNVAVRVAGRAQIVPRDELTSAYPDRQRLFFGGGVAGRWQRGTSRPSPIRVPQPHPDRAAESAADKRRGCSAPESFASPPGQGI